ncbi:hypothetical protein EMIHUDRAFT_438693 [Emiliania huxleyi CCMP1516]|uniref:GrpE protein homolog n=2 Tax=Emiliania huxleyi TaxID=2903 RepID=A0A0D3I5P7_EMIH1|nr:hypothetical protein EMIHUDRAFT_438693 [Emiliania huxleyi CCMP1516]EOD06582.1 hypothetical protein EMIHUDRAFT_438693 [Emiliania huxleyi CCMP1516]|eukprot:XP_005759011.1 hypothetical protein EMIHUDRAFT_438693 [Emiliania huxleyi CCMP1516]
MLLLSPATLALALAGAPLRTPGHAAGPPALLLSPLRAARVCAAVMLEADGAAADGTGVDGPAAGEGASEASTRDAAGAEPAEAAAEVVEEEEEEEEEEDLLSSPAFLKQKLKVLEAELSKVEEDTAALKGEADSKREEWSSQRQRLQTDLENFQSRHKSQVADIRTDAKIKVVNELLPMMDNFDRARGSIKADDEAQELANGRYLELHASLMAALEGLGVQKIETVGQEFDYNLHMAIQQVPSEEYAEGLVCEEMQPGFTCNDKLVRAAYVMVSSG